MSLAATTSGTDRQGSVALANASHGVLIMSASNTVGGSAAGAGNVISSNGGSGVWLLGTSATNNVVVGNLIGTNFQGTSALGNAGDGVTVGIGTNNVIGGTSAALRNVISGNARIGVLIEGAGATANRVIGNYIGTDATGAADLGNGFDGVFVSVSGNVVGGPTAAEGNVISGNGRAGVNLGGIGAVGNNVVQSNLIGVSAAGGGALPNAYGVYLESSGNTIGGTAGNFIAHNTLAGIDVRGNQNRISRNRIASNSGLGIDLGGDGVTANDSSDTDGGANNRQNFPVLTAARGGVDGTLSSTATTTFSIQFFGSPVCDSSQHGEGETFLGEASVTTNAEGNAAIPFFAAATGQVVTATATDASGNTSEFSACVSPDAANTRPVANAGPDQTAYVDRLVTLDGNGSDPDDDDLTYAWSFTSRPSRQPGHAVQRRDAFIDVHS